MSTILIVDDSPTEIIVVQKMLANKGHTVATATNGAEGIAAAKTQKPDLILMDIVMPDMNGFKATREISKDQEISSIPVIMMSAKDQVTDKEWAKRQGASGYLVKPVKENELLAAIDTALGG